MFYSLQQNGVQHIEYYLFNLNSFFVTTLFYPGEKNYNFLKNFIDNEFGDIGILTVEEDFVSIFYNVEINGDYFNFTLKYTGDYDNIKLEIVEDD